MGHRSKGQHLGMALVAVGVVAIAAIVPLALSGALVACGSTESGLTGYKVTADGGNTNQSCDGGSCVAICTSALTACGLTCIDTTSDTQNCGACGATCAGTCANSRCLVNLVAGQSHPAGLAIDATNLYWTTLGETNTSTGTIGLVPLSGGSVTTLASAQSQPSSIVVVGTNVYWTAGKTIYRAPTTPVDGGTASNYTSGNQPTDLFTDGISLFWTNYGTGTTNDGTVMLRNIKTNAQVTIATGQPQPRGIVADTSTVYWTNYAATPTGGSIAKATATPVVTDAGPTSTTVASTLPQPFGIVVDATAIYWTDSGDGTVVTVPITGGTPTTLAQNQGVPRGIAVDDTNVYWVNYTDGNVNRIAKTGGAITTLASTQQAPRDIVLSSTNVYWSNSGGSTITTTEK